MQQAAQDNRAPGAGPLKTLVVCVDDFGYDGQVDDSILALARQGRVSATSVLVDAPRWPADAAALASLGDRLDVGLHLNLSESFAAGPRQLEWRSLVLRAYLGGLRREAMRREIARQLDAFEAGFGRAPDFVDGHRHVHQLPVVREALIEELAARYSGPRKPWLRRTTPAHDACASTGERFKAWVIGALGAGGLSRLARGAGFPQNRHLLGVYGFAGSRAEHEARLARWLAAAGEGDVLMCHTALPGGVNAADPIASARVVEHEVLASPDFGQMLQQAGVRVGRLARAAG